MSGVYTTILQNDLSLLAANATLPVRVCCLDMSNEAGPSWPGLVRRCYSVSGNSISLWEIAHSGAFFFFLSRSCFGHSACMADRSVFRKCEFRNAVSSNPLRGVALTSMYLNPVNPTYLIPA